MSSTFEVYLEKLRGFFKNLITLIEESSLFERAVMKYEGLDPQQQRWVRMGGFAGSLILIVGLVCGPLLYVVWAKNQIASYRTLLEDLRMYQAESQVVHQGPSLPSTWKPMGASSAAEAKTSLENYMNQIGLPSDTYQLDTAGGELSLDIKELSIKQALSLIYQLDGWHPVVVLRDLNVSVNPTAKDLLVLTASLQFRGGANFSSDNGPRSRGSNNGRPGRIDSGGPITSRTGGPPGSGINPYDPPSDGSLPLSPPPPPPPSPDFFEEDL